MVVMQIVRTLLYVQRSFLIYEFTLVLQLELLESGDRDLESRGSYWYAHVGT